MDQSSTLSHLRYVFSKYGTSFCTFSCGVNYVREVIVNEVEQEKLVRRVERRFRPRVRMLMTILRRALRLNGSEDESSA